MAMIHQEAIAHNYDSAEFLPKTSFFVIGGYHLDTNTNLKSGSIQLFSTKSSECVQFLQTPAILDLKWSEKIAGLLGHVNSSGSVDLIKLSDHNVFEKYGKVDLAAGKTGVMTLSLDWNDRVMKQIQELQLIVSGSDGNLHLVAVESSGVNVVRSWKAHEFEAWISAFDYFNPSVVYSGADDCMLRGWDLKSGCKLFQLEYEMGITTIQHHLTREYILAVGSYDEKIRIYDTRMMKKESLSSIQVGSGIWRVKWNPNPNYHDLLAVAKMRSGFGCYYFNHELKNENNLTLISEYRNEEKDNCSKSLAYGIDWNQNIDSPLQTVTCSFYDSKFQLWSVPFHFS